MNASLFFGPLYKNFDNVLLAKTLTFNQLTPQQVYAQEISELQNPSGLPTTAYLNYTAQGEADSIGGGVVTFNYIDPGTINTLTAFGMQLPGSFALQLKVQCRYFRFVKLQ